MPDYDHYTTETVIVSERNPAGQIICESNIERTFQDGIERQTTVRQWFYDPKTGQVSEGEGHGPGWAAAPAVARKLIKDAEDQGLLTKTETPVERASKHLRGPGYVIRDGRTVNPYDTREELEL